MSTEETLRLTVAALLNRTGEQQAALAAAIDLSPTGLSRRQSGRLRWSLDDCDRLAAHWGISTLDLLSGPSHAADKLPADRLPSGQAAPARTSRSSTPPPQSATEPNAPAPSAAVETTAPAAPAPVTPRPARPRPAESDLGTTIMGKVARVLRDHDGDHQAALHVLTKKDAIEDVMGYFHQSRVGGRYEHRDYPPTHDVLKKRSQKEADAIWEGRPKYVNTALEKAVKRGDVDPMDVAALDVNAAYLAAFKTRLPLGQLVHDASGVHDPKRAGVHLITPPGWDHSDLPSPLGARMQPGDLWVTEPTLRLLIECASKGLCEAPIIRESLTSGSTEGLLEKLRRTLADIRMNAINNDDDLTVEYVKAMYSKFVSTLGESSANRGIRRPDWMHIIRSQAFANIWRRAYKAHSAGLTVVRMSGTDELHVIGEWREVFTDGRGIAEMKHKYTYTLGDDQ